MPILLVAGPGGAGTTTLAAAAAVRSARSGRTTLLLSRQAPGVPGLEDVEGLRVVRAGGQAALERVWGRHAANLSAALPLVSVPPAGAVPALPGMADLALLAELARAEADVAVVDAGTPEGATGLLALPMTLRWWLEHLLPERLRVLATLRAASLDADSPARRAADAALDGLAALQAALERVPLSDPAATSVLLTAPARLPAVPALRAVAGVLGLHGQHPTAVAVRVLAGGQGEWWTARGAEQDEALAGLAAIGEVVRVEERASSPAGPDELATLATGLPDPGRAPARPAADPEPEKIPGGWRLTVPLPFAVRGDMELTRWADDVIVTVHGSRRSFRLDSLLRRCRVTGGTLADAGSPTARLEVSFAPDPQQWPADLLSAHQRAAAEESG